VEECKDEKGAGAGRGRRVVSKLTQGNIILMHDTSERTLHVLEQLLKYLKANDYQVVLDL